MDDIVAAVLTASELSFERSPDGDFVIHADDGLAHHMAMRNLELKALRTRQDQWFELVVQHLSPVTARKDPADGTADFSIAAPLIRSRIAPTSWVDQMAGLNGPAGSGIVHRP